jgi:hypothetical protein
MQRRRGRLREGGRRRRAIFVEEMYVAQIIAGDVKSDKPIDDGGVAEWQ